ncbi:extensin [Streptomyces boninensis]|uniref:extensin n=1 Tax=Streptomyces boninensis TaxID=2039455 RepID=UPI003B20CBAB
MPETLTSTAAAEVRALLNTLTRFLAGVAVLALVFTAVNVTLFAVASGIPWPIAILLDPLVALTLSAVLYADARLAALGIRPPVWSAVLRWGCGLTATLLNTWTSLWPDHQLGWPRHADIAGVVLHAVPPLLLIGLTETVAAYRRTLADLAHTETGTALSHETDPHHEGGAQECRPSSPDASVLSTIHRRSNTPEVDPWIRFDDAPIAPSGSMTALDRGGIADSALGVDPAPADGSDPRSTPSPPLNPQTMPRSQPASAAHGTRVGSQAADSAPTATLRRHGPRPDDESPADGDLFTRALALDAACRSHYGRPVSIRRLRTELHLGPKRARALHDRIQARHAEHATR